MTILAALLLAVQAPAAAPLDDYAQRAVGRFTSAEQAAADPRYDVVEATVVRIWPERTDGVWLYQEQAIVGGQGAPAGASLERPYFQRVGHIRMLPDGRMRRDNYVLREPARFVGLGRRAAVAAPTQADLGAAGCHNIIERVSHGWFTARMEECANSWRGAVRMTSLAVSGPDLYVNWDRGFDTAGQRVWGPAEGGYVFRRAR